MPELYPYIKALHLIFVITWFAGLFYMPRLFIYHIESADRPESEAAALADQFRIMQRRLWYIITWPSAVLCIGFALWLLLLNPGWLYQSWMQVKLGFVLVLLAYHLATHRMFLRFRDGSQTYSSRFMRLWNEGATLILFAVVFLAVLKDGIRWMFGLGGFLALAVLLMLGIRLYRKARDR